MQYSGLALVMAGTLLRSCSLTCVPYIVKRFLKFVCSSLYLDGTCRPKLVPSLLVSLQLTPNSSQERIKTFDFRPHENCLSPCDITMISDQRITSTRSLNLQILPLILRSFSHSMRKINYSEEIVLELMNPLHLMLEYPQTPAHNYFSHYCATFHSPFFHHH